MGPLAGRRRAMISARSRQLCDQALDVVDDTPACRFVAVTHSRNIPLIDALPLGRRDVAAEAHDPRRTVEVVERNRASLLLKLRCERGRLQRGPRSAEPESARAP